jgi:DNA-binding response OmpR family regulator
MIKRYSADQLPMICRSAMTGSGERTMSTAAELGHRVGFDLGTLNVRPANCEVEGSAGLEHVEPRVMQVLVTLSDAQGATVTRDDLLATCWSGRIVGDDALNRVIGKIRKIAGRLAAESFRVTTVPKIGYRLSFADKGETAEPTNS